MRRGTILVVEDDPGFRDLVVEILSEAGYHVDCCTDAEDAFYQAHRLHPDLLIIDLWMRHKRDDGWTLIMALRGSESTRTLPAILISGDVHALQARDGVLRAEHGLTLEKPFTANALMTRVAEAFAL